MSDPELAERVRDFSRVVVTDCVREVLERHRVAVLSGAADRVPERSALVDEIAGRAARETRGSIVRVVNATGVVVHTNIGRAPLAPSALEAIRLAGERFINLEIDLESGKRSRREIHTEALLRRLTGAEASLVVNNNAAAVLLCLTALAKGREVIVSRGELIEIGGSFRLPQVMEQSGAKLVEVGTTNKTYLGDYAGAVRPETALLLKAHPSNFRIEGFVSQVPLGELVALGRERQIPVLFDAGSGALAGFESRGFEEEPAIGGAVAEGADLVTFSADKLLGGPQAGIIVGRADLVDRVRRHPLHRALRLDKLSLAALAATLREHLDPVRARSRVPVLRMLFEPAESLHRRAEALAAVLGAACGANAAIDCIEGESEAGGGSLPGAHLPTTLVRVRPAALSAARAEERLRRGDPAVLCRIAEDALLFDPRALLEGDDEAIGARMREVLS